MIASPSHAQSKKSITRELASSWMTTRMVSIQAQERANVLSGLINRQTVSLLTSQSTDHQSDSHTTHSNQQMTVRDATPKAGCCSEWMSLATSSNFTKWLEEMVHYGIVAGSGLNGRLIQIFIKPHAKPLGCRLRA